jgi:beta-glucanase (GH16 family)
MKNLRSKTAALLAACWSGVAPAALLANTTTLLDLNFNSPASYPAYHSPGVTGIPGVGFNVVSPTLPGAPNFDSGLFATAPTSGYLALTSDPSTTTPAAFWGGWASNVTLATVNSLYAAGGFGQSDLSKVALTARVRATGVPAGGAVVILELRGSGDDPNVPIAGYRRIRFEPIFLEGNDWVEIGGSLDIPGLTAAQGSIYNFPTNAAQYSVLVELSGFNRLGQPGYVAYNTPTGTPNPDGRKNPGFTFAGGIRVEVDDVRLVVTDAATTGYLDPTTPNQLLRNGDFNLGNSNWTVFEGAYVADNGWSEDGSFYALIPGFGGSPFAGFMQNSIVVDPANGEFFTATFRANFESNYQAERTIVAFMDGSGVQTFLEVDISGDIAARLNQWHTYQATFRATPEEFAAMNGTMSFKIQPLNRTADGTPFSSALIDDIVLSQAPASAVGPQLGVRLAGASRNDGEAATLVSPVLNQTTSYPLALTNQGAQDLTISNVALTGTDFVLGEADFPILLAPGASRTILVATSPTVLGPLSGGITISSNDNDPADQTWVVTLATNAVTLSDTFDTAATLEQLGWFTFASSANLGSTSSLTVSGGAMNLNVDSSTDDYPWTYIASKPFASTGAIDLASSFFEISLRAEGVFAGLPNNKVQVRLESLNAAGGISGMIEFGVPIDDSTAGAAPGSPAYFSPDGNVNRVAILLPEGGGYTVAGGNLLTMGVNTSFNPEAPAFRLVVQMTDFDFDLSAGNLVQIDYINLTLGVKPFLVTNGGFEADLTDPGTGSPPAGWLQFPAEGVSKNLVTNGDPLFNVALQDLDPAATFSAYAGESALKVFGQNFYIGDVWQGPSQTGTVYQSFILVDNASLVPGTVLHARAVAKIFSIDPMTGGSSFNFGFQYLDAVFNEVGRDVATLDASSPVDTWSALVVNSTIPAGASRVQIISEFVQNNATDGGAVYLDEVSIGFGDIAPTVTVGDSEYVLVWSDEFDGNALNLANWTPELGTGTNGWGNNEVQTYTANPENLRVENGVLVIEARKEGDDWTSARIKTEGKRSFQYGKIKFRAKLPTGVGPWPAAWMLGENFSQVGWPASGEIDVMEWRGTKPGLISHATHGPSNFGGNAISVEVPVANLGTAFHTYAVVWEPGQVTFSVDGVTSGSWSTADVGEPFEQEFFLLLNLAMGGSFLGNQIDPALTSARYEVDYVRVYQAAEAGSLTGYQQYLADLGLPTNLAFDADFDGDGISEGIRYAFGAASPRLGQGAPSLERSGDSLTYTFDLRADGTLGVTPELSNDLVDWAVADDYLLSDLPGAAEGFVRQVLAIENAPGERLFLRVSINNDN